MNSKIKNFLAVARELSKSPQKFFSDTEDDSFSKPFLCSEQSADNAFASLFY